METRHPSLLGAEGRPGWGTPAGQPQRTARQWGRGWAGMSRTAAPGEKPNGAGCCLGRGTALLHPHPHPTPPLPCGSSQFSWVSREKINSRDVKQHPKKKALLCKARFCNVQAKLPSVRSQQSPHAAGACCQVGHTPAKGGRDMSWTTKPAKASTAVKLTAGGFGGASARSHRTHAANGRCGRKEKASVLPVGCAGATRARGTQGGPGGITAQQPRAGLLQARRQRLVFLASLFLMGAVGEDGQKQNRLQ